MGRIYPECHSSSSDREREEEEEAQEADGGVLSWGGTSSLLGFAGLPGSGSAYAETSAIARSYVGPG